MSFLETRGMLAKLLATENLIIQHSSKADTASFDVDNRVLTLPMLQTDDENLYNMFVAHECGHALWTPQNFDETVPDDVPFDYINVVEDVRIEKAIQDKFPGLKRDFTKGYDVLKFMNFFEIDGKDLSTLNLIDRINLHYKLGALECVPFSPDEKVLADKVDTCETFDEVCAVAREIAEFVQAHKPEKQETDTETEPRGSKGGKQESDEQKGDGEPKAGTDNEGQDMTSSTQQALNDNMKSMTSGDKWREDVIYCKAPDVDLTSITTVDELRASFVVGESEAVVAEVKDDYDKFMSSIKRDVNFMVQQFEMKKSADAYSRIQENKTGVLNTDILHQYKLTDDIFLRQTITPDGKNHGMVMLIDWSGSMSNTIIPTVKQILVLTQFCRKAGIPFEVYSFTSGGRQDHKPTPFVAGEVKMSDNQVVQVLSSTAKRSEIDQDMFNLFSQASCLKRSYEWEAYTHSELLRMGGTPLNSVLFMMPAIMKRFREQTGAQRVSFVCVTDGASSPIAINDYKRDADGQLMYADDGTARKTTISPYYQTVMVRDGYHTTQLERGKSQTQCIVEWLKSKLGDVSITHFFLGSEAVSRRYIDEQTGRKPQLKDFKKLGSSVIELKTGWPLIVVMNPNSFGDAIEEIECDDGATKVQIKNALKKFLKSKSSSKVVLAKLVDNFA